MSKWIKLTLILGTLAAIAVGVVWYLRKDDDS